MTLAEALLTEELLTSALPVSRQEIRFAIRTDGDGIGDGSTENPFAVNTVETFAQRMQQIPQGIPVHIRLGPGVFRTRGGPGVGFIAGEDRLWTVRSNWKISGCGMFQSILRFDWDLSADGAAAQKHFMVTSLDNSFAPNFELSDLTLDCNLGGAPFDPTTISSSGVLATVATSGGVTTATVSPLNPFFDDMMKGKAIAFPNGFSATITGINQTGTIATLSRQPGAGVTISNQPFWIVGVRTTVTALSVTGDNTLYKRVRVINWGTRCSPLFNGENLPGGLSAEGFPCRFAGRTVDRAASNARMEDCIIEQPFPGQARESTVVVAAGGVYLSTNGIVPAPKLHLQPFGAVLRNCQVNGEVTNPLPGRPVRISGPITFSGASGSVTAGQNRRIPVA